MKSVIVEIHCPVCMWHMQKTSDTLIIPEFETDLKKLLMEGRYFHLHCPRCGTKIGYYHTCVYTDKKHGFVLMMKPEKEAKEADHHFYQGEQLKKRYVFCEEEIAEKISILEAGLDDRVIEVLKLKVYIQAKKAGRKLDEIQFYDVDQDSESIWFTAMEEEMQTMMAVTMQSYQTLLKQLPKEDWDHFVSVDLSWALAYIKRQR